MICPNCKAEYRPGFTRCSDCDVGLVEHLGESSEQASENLEKLVGLWSGSDTRVCTVHRRTLEKARIPYKLLHKEDRLFNISQYPELEILVPEELLEDAKAAIGEDDAALSGDDGGGAELELRAGKDVDLRDLDKSDWEPGDPYPEDATVEVWSELPGQNGWMMEASLRENHIPLRMEMQSDGSRKYFVLPDDEKRAREIVREVVEGAPPE
jgi:hypothetical protein